MSFIIKERARLDLKQHWHWIARDNLNAADKLLRAAEGTFVSIAKNPERLPAQFSQARSHTLKSYCRI